MKRTIIKYRNVGKDKVQIVGIENCASIVDIVKEFGRIAAQKYFKSSNNRYAMVDSGAVRIFGIDGSINELIAGRHYPRGYLNKAVSIMKIAGDTLGGIVNEEREREASQIKEIVI